MGYFSGAYGIFMTVYAVSVTGLPAAVAKITAENSALERFANARRVKSAALLFFSVTGLVFTLIMLLLAYPFCLITGSIETVPSVLAIAPSIFFGCVTSVYRGYYEGLRNMVPTAISQIVEGLAKLALGLALCLFVLKNPHRFSAHSEYCGGSVLPIAAAASVLGITISTAAGTLFLIICDKLSGDGITPEQIYATGGTNCLDSRKEIISKLLKTAVPIAIGALITNLTSLIDLVTIIRSLQTAISKNSVLFSEISVNTSIAELPNFLFGCFTGLAVTIFNLVPSFTNMFGKGILPSLSEAFVAKDKSKIREQTEKALLATSLIAFPCGIGISVLSEEILRVLFPSKPLETSLCVLPLSILGIGVIFLCLSSTIFSVLQAADRPDLPVKLMLSGVAVKLAGNLILVRIPRLNIAGAAISTMLCYAVICVPAIAMLIRLTEINKGKLTILLCKISYCSVMCGTAVFLARNILGNDLNTAAVLFISILLGGIFYIISTLLLGIITKSTVKMLIS